MRPQEFAGKGPPARDPRGIARRGAGEPPPTTPPVETRRREFATALNAFSVEEFLV